MYITVYIEVLFFLIFFCTLASNTVDGVNISEDGDSVAWDGGVSSMAGLNLRSQEASSRPR